VTHFEGRTFMESILSRAEGFKTTIYAGVNLSTVVQIDHTPISFFPRVAGEDEEGGARLNVPMLAVQTESLPSGNTKNGNKYLSWAFIEAANFAIRFRTSVPT
jgi:hypothetical protein